MGGNDPVDGFSVYTVEDPLHWHYITYGFSELYEKQSPNKENSGWGFELTFRLIKTADEKEPPKWVMSLIQNLAKYVFESGNIFRDGDTMSANGPISIDDETELTAMFFIEDPILKTIETPNGEVKFLQMIGITNDELEVKQDLNKEFLLETLLDGDNIHITDLNRKSVVNNEKTSNRIEELQKTIPSSMGYVYIQNLSWKLKKEQITITTGALNIESIKKALKRRFLFDEIAILSAENSVLKLQKSESNSVLEQKDTLELNITTDTVNELIGKLHPKEDTYSFETYPELTIIVEKTDIKNSDGDIVETVG